MTLLPRDRAAWGRLCRLISAGRLKAVKGSCALTFDDLVAWGDGQEMLIHPSGTRAPMPGGAAAWAKAVERLTRRFPGQASLVLAPQYDGQDRPRFDRLAARAAEFGLTTVASAEPLMHTAARRKLTDVLTAVRLGRRVDQLGRAALANAERRLRSEAEMLRLFQGHEAAVHRAGEIAARLGFSLDELRYEYPSEVAEGETATQRLARLAREGLDWRYPNGATERVRTMLAHELALIAKLKYEPYFLTVRDIVSFARERGILCQGRGSAANSVVCYCLGVTSVSPEVGTMVFERFVSEARDEPPDIDVDFEHERREEVIQHIYERYGRHRAGLCATVIHYRGKRAIREVGRAMGLSDDTLSALSSQLWGFFSADAVEDRRFREIGLDPDDPRLQQTMSLIYEVQGFPRHLSQHVGGFIITEGRLDELVPIENATMEDRTVICWDKDDIDALGILKVDVLALGMLTCIRKAFDLVEKHHEHRWALATLPPEDPRVYDMLCQADSVGVFQVERRAQMNFLPRMRPRTFYDLVIEVAIIRPGPIQGDMVHPFIRRRNGEEAVNFPSDELGRVLGKTLGVPLFQEQAMQIAIIGAGFTPEEADRLRRSLATFKKHGSVSEFHDRFLKGMAQNGYDADFAAALLFPDRGLRQLRLPRKPCRLFALLVYASAWLKLHHPGIFACALLNSQPMGFYAPAQIVRDAREHGVAVLPVSVQPFRMGQCDGARRRGRAGAAPGVPPDPGVPRGRGRLDRRGARQRLSRVEDVWRRAGVGPATLQRCWPRPTPSPPPVLAAATPCGRPGQSPPAPLPLFARDLDGEGIAEPDVTLPRDDPGRGGGRGLRRHAADAAGASDGAVAPASDPRHAGRAGAPARRPAGRGPGAAAGAVGRLIAPAPAAAGRDAARKPAYETGIPLSRSPTTGATDPIAAACMKQVSAAILRSLRCSATGASPFRNRWVSMGPAIAPGPAA